MPVYALDHPYIFPHPVLREPDGLMAVGGDLSPGRLILAYRWGIFPWYSEGQPIMWWWLCPRLMLRPAEIHISHSMRNLLHRNPFTVTFNQQFETVMRKCASVPRPGQDGTWITDEMIEAYVTLHNMGFAHSVEVWEEDTLVGGLYGIALGSIFTGESMFAERSNASKIGFITLAAKLEAAGYAWIDCQQDTPHMRTFGGSLLKEEEFLNILRSNHRKPQLRFA